MTNSSLFFTIKVLRYFVCLGFFTSCNILDKEPIDAIKTDHLFKNASDAEAAIIGAYEILTSSDGYYGGRLGALADVPTNNLKATQAFLGFYEINRFNFQPENEVFFSVWSDLYTGIDRTNVIIEYAQNANISNLGEGKNRILAEARFLRAFHYFNLVRLFGAVPLLIKSAKVADLEVLRVARSPVDEVYNLIFDDLFFAENSLPQQYDSKIASKGRATVAAAKALLARIYLYRSEFSEAAMKANEVLNITEYTLSENYTNLFIEQLTDEAIWEIPFSFQKKNDIVFNYFPEELGGWYWLIPSQDIFDTYEPGDLRKTGTFETINGMIYMKKHFRIDTGEDSKIVFRLAELILTRAEALASLNYPSEEALYLLNRIHNRAGLESLTFEDLPDQPAFQVAIEKERRLELAYEGHYWHDLVRTNRLEAVLGITEPYKHLFPIPQSELDLNDKLTQNPGY